MSKGLVGGEECAVGSSFVVGVGVNAVFVPCRSDYKSALDCSEVFSCVVVVVSMPQGKLYETLYRERRMSMNIEYEPHTKRRVGSRGITYSSSKASMSSNICFNLASAAS